MAYHFVTQLKKQKAILWMILIALIGVAVSSFLYTVIRDQEKTIASLHSLKDSLETNLQKTSTELTAMKNNDQFVRNEKLSKEIKAIEEIYKSAAASYEELVKLKSSTNKTADLDTQYAKIISLLAEKNVVSASATLTELNNEIKKKQAEIASTFTIPQSVSVNNNPPGSGYSRQAVQIDIGTYMVDIISADLNSTRVIVDTASDGTCTDNCPVMALGDYAARSGAFAAINGPYFCPAEYPSCAGKTNSFDTLIMNKNKVYFNSDNNVYSTVPLVIFTGNSARFYGQSLEWGRDTGIDSVIAAQPMLVSNGNVVFGGDDEVKRAGKGSRSFIGTSDNMVYIGVVHNANVAEVARVLKGMGIKNALNLDSGGSTALWNGRYIVGPGRALPFGILLVRK